MRVRECECDGEARERIRLTARVRAKDGGEVEDECDRGCE